MLPTNASSYRPEIDGLRAIAVVAVVLYHFGMPFLGGGFVGVDVFFVISGFLIGGILWIERTTTGHIDLKAFFLRRIKRLAPSFFAMATATTIAAYFILLPFEFRAFGKELIASTTWLSNVHFFREAGYFDVASDSKILLHTWSLAVEEQFYLALPVLLLFLRKTSPRTTIFVIVATWAASLASCIAVTSMSPTATFFLFPFRAWEMLSGVLLAIWCQQTGALRRHGPLLSWVGLSLVLSAIILVKPGSSFPGWQALWPVLGAVLILLNGQDNNAVNRLLAHRVPVFFGLISYSLYLWHWPVLTLSKYWQGNYSSATVAVGWLTLTLILSIAAWAWIERPARYRLTNRALLTGFALLCAISLLSGAWAYRSNGAPGRFGPPARTHIDASGSFYYDESRCNTATEGPLKEISVCSVGPAGTPTVLFWGDSHLRAMMGGVDRAAQEANTPALLIWHAGCPPLFGLSKRENSATAAQDAKCLGDNLKLMNALPTLKHLQRVVLVGRWTYYASGSGYGNDAHNRISLSSAPGLSLRGESQLELYESAWALTTEVLSRHFEEIHVFRQVPEMPRYSSPDFAKRLVHGRIGEAEAQAALRVEAGELKTRTEDAEIPLKNLAASGALQLIDSWPRLCRPQCEVMLNGQSLYFDNNHLNTRGADALRDLWLQALKGVLPR